MGRNVVVGFEFSSGLQGWRSGFSDYDPSNIQIYSFRSGLRKTPKSVGNKNSLFIASMNRSDDVFMFFQREIRGLKPLTIYEAEFRITFVTRYDSSIGIGGDPARDVFVKVCQSKIEPTLSLDDFGTLRLDIDIGMQKNAGQNSIVLGNIEKPPNSKEQYVEVERRSEGSLRLITNGNGSVWLLFGTDSGYEGETELNYTSFQAFFSQTK